MLSRSKFVFIISIWTLLYGYLIQQPDVQGMAAILTAVAVWPLFFIAQIIFYALFKNYHNHKLYILLILVKSSLFLIQPLLIGVSTERILFALSVLVIFLIDFHIMTLNNKVDLSMVTVTDQKKKTLSNQMKEDWILMGSVVILLALYFQLEANNYTIIPFFGLLYWFGMIRKRQEKAKLIIIQILTALLVWLITLLNTPETIKGVFILLLLIIVYAVKKRIFQTIIHS